MSTLKNLWRFQLEMLKSFVRLLRLITAFLWWGISLTTIQPLSHELVIGGSGETHPKGQAIDFSFPTIVHNEIVRSIVSRSEVFHRLREMGINGFGVYDSFIHLDDRPQKGLKHKDNEGVYAFWDNRKKKIFDLSMTNEDGMAKNPISFFALIFIILVPFGYIIYTMIKRSRK